MEPNTKKQLIKYLAWTFGIAWAMQGIVTVFYMKGQAATGQLIMAVMMFVPLLGTALAGQPLKEIGWKPGLKGNLRPFLIAWLLPIALTAVGAALYFLVFPGHLDLTGQAAGPELVRQLEEQGLTYSQYILIMIASACVEAPWINMLVSAGEEAGWRGFLYPLLKEAYGTAKGRTIGGIIWGAWHWPLIGLVGYEYGTSYAGFPVSGMLIFCFFTVAIGVLCDFLYEWSGTIWAPSLLHGSINAAATIPLGICLAERGSLSLLGPAPNGVLAGLPLLILGALLLARSARPAAGEEELGEKK